QRVKPQCQQNLGVGRIAPGHSFARLDRRLEAAQIHRLQHPPDRTRWMIARQPRIEIDRLQVQLLTISFSQPHHFLHHPTSTSTIIPLAPQNAIPKYKKITNSERSRRDLGQLRDTRPITVAQSSADGEGATSDEDQQGFQISWRIILVAITSAVAPAVDIRIAPMKLWALTPSTAKIIPPIPPPTRPSAISAIMP